MTSSQRQILVGLGVMVSIAVVNYVLFGLMKQELSYVISPHEADTAIEIHSIGILEWRRTEISMAGGLESFFDRGRFIGSAAISVIHLAACLGVMWKLGKPGAPAGAD